jgi:hypothetical protein
MNADATKRIAEKLRPDWGPQMAIFESAIYLVPPRGRKENAAGLLDARDIAHEAAAIERECRQALLTSLLPQDELIGRLRSSMVVAKARKDGKL